MATIDQIVFEFIELGYAVKKGPEMVYYADKRLTKFSDVKIEIFQKTHEGKLEWFVVEVDAHLKVNKYLTAPIISSDYQHRSH